MDIMEKVEQLRARANISYEEAKAVLDETGGDLLDAAILLEKRGKIKKPETELTAWDEKSAGEEKTASQDSFTKETGYAKEESKKVKNTFRKIINVLKNNSFNISRKGEDLFVMPAWAFVLILVFFWHTVLPVMIIALFFDVRYAFTGKDDLSEANRFMDKVGSMADEMSSEFK